MQHLLEVLKDIVSFKIMLSCIMRQNLIMQVVANLCRIHRQRNHASYVLRYWHCCFWLSSEVCSRACSFKAKGYKVGITRGVYGSD